MINSPVIILLTLFLTIYDVNGIICGRDAYEGQFGYMVSIWLGGRFQCGGGIINENHILTAGICVHEMPINATRVVAGKILLFDPSSQYLSVERMMVHPNYNMEFDRVDRRAHNIAVLRLEDRLEWSPTIRPMTFPTTSDVCYCCVCEMAGWGKTCKLSTELSIPMKWTTALFLREEACYKLGIHLVENEFCASDVFDLSVVSQGDTGGLFTCYGRAMGIVVGAVNLEHVDGDTIVLSIYPYLSFIDDAINHRL